MTTRRSSNSTTPVYNISGLAEQTGLSRPTIYEWMGKNIIRPSLRLGSEPDGLPLFTESDVRRVKAIAVQRGVKSD